MEEFGENKGKMELAWRFCPKAVLPGDIWSEKETGAMGIYAQILLKTRQDSPMDNRPSANRLFHLKKKYITPDT